MCWSEGVRRFCLRACLGVAGRQAGGAQKPAAGQHFVLVRAQATRPCAPYSMCLVLPAY